MFNPVVFLLKLNQVFFMLSAMVPSFITKYQQLVKKFQGLSHLNGRQTKTTQMMQHYLQT